jgi:RND family efflux transporter MFP subunit
VVDHAQLDAQVAQAQAAVRAAQAVVQAAQAQAAAAHAQRLNAIAVRQSADAQLESAKAGLVKAQAQLTDAQSTFARTQALAQEGAVSQQTLDDARAQVQTAKAGVDAAQAQIGIAQAQIAQAAAQAQAAQEQETAAAAQLRTQQAQVATQEAALENTRLQLAYATIVAPFTGVVVNRTLGPGAYVTPGTSTPILTVADLDRLYVVVHIAESEFSTVHRGDATHVRVDAYPTQVFRGVVSKIAGGVDPVTRTVQVEIDVPNPGHPLRPGMYATASLEAGSQPALVVPLAALVTVGTQHFVWGITDDGKVTQRPVTVGRATGEVVEITSGLTVQDAVVVRGTDLVREGQPVQTAPVSP